MCMMRKQTGMVMQKNPTCPGMKDCKNVRSQVFIGAEFYFSINNILMSFETQWYHASLHIHYTTIRNPSGPLSSSSSG